ncbi:hypothetical protein [Hoeflea sp.]|uniref:hypothetical protein n=1 Tax=Hoeflea sp. TaxID=1940281 RepID=UPI003B02DF2C
MGIAETGTQTGASRSDHERPQRQAVAVRIALPSGALFFSCAATVHSVQPAPAHLATALFASGLTVTAIGLWKVRCSCPAQTIVLTANWIVAGLCALYAGFLSISGWSYALPVGCTAAVLRLPGDPTPYETLPVLGLLLAALSLLFANNGKGLRHGD